MTGRFPAPISYGLLDRHEVENGRKGRCRKRKAKVQKSHRRSGSTGRIIVFFPAAKQWSSTTSGLIQTLGLQVLGLNQNWGRHTHTYGEKERERERSSGPLAQGSESSGQCRRH